MHKQRLPCQQAPAADHAEVSVPGYLGDTDKVLRLDSGNLSRLRRTLELPLIVARSFGVLGLLIRPYMKSAVLW